MSEGSSSGTLLMEPAAAPAAPDRRILYALMFLVTFLWSVNFLTAKVAMRQWPPVLLTGVRTLLALVFCLPLYWRSRPHAWDWPLFWRFFALGTLGMGTNQMFFAMGVKRTSIAHGSLIVGMTPVFVYLISCLANLEIFRPKKLIGMAVALIGIGTLQAKSTSGASLEGDALVFLGITSFTIFTVFSKPLSGRLNPFGTVTLNYIGASVFLLPATVVMGKDFPFHQLLPVSWLCLLFMAAVPSVFCFVLYHRVLPQLPASQVSTFTYLQPVIASGLAIPFLGESLSPTLLGGGLLILLGVWLTERF